MGIRQTKEENACAAEDGGEMHDGCGCCLCCFWIMYDGVLRVCVGGRVVCLLAMRVYVCMYGCMYLF